ncbi:MAG: single-stranded-DNA-specific exonuclease RecJ [Nannocystaceae bacterium]|nr:single-stranded-DNA-specific exonuclease RecJ [Nannocystaceae bacterium]
MSAAPQTESQRAASPPAEDTATPGKSSGAKAGDGRRCAPPRPNVELRGPDGDLASADADAVRLSVPPIVAFLMRARGVVSPEDQACLLAPKLASLRRPDAMAGFSAALDRIELALNTNETIGVFGDYDVDGVSTAAILSTYLEALGATVVVKVAHRGQGYGFTVKDAASFAEAGAGLVLTGDCGTSDIEALTWLADRGIGRIVIDHHQVPERMPPADALINPHQDACKFPFKGLCSAGVAFYLCAALRTRLAPKREQVPDPRAWLDLVALATVCDMMPLHDENRVLVTHGLRLLGQRRRPGLKALLKRAGVDNAEPLDASHLGFKLGPRLNAPGRLGSAMPALSLLRARTDAEATPLAEQIEALNAQRKQHTERTVADAMAILAADPRLEQRAGLVVHHDAWLPGVVGIAAAGLVERFGRPALVLAVDRATGEARGSVRSVEGIDVRAALLSCSDIIVRCGGHPQAAGVTVMAEHLEALTERFDAAVAQQGLSRGATEDTEVVDMALPLSEVCPELVEAMRSLGPYGVGFEPPRFYSDDVRVSSAKVVGVRHLALRVSQGEARFDAIAFGQAQDRPAVGDTIGLIYVPYMGRFRGEARLKLQVERIWRST